MEIVKNVNYFEDRDVELIEKGINYNVNLMCGSDKIKQQELKKYIAVKCRKVCAIDPSNNHPILNNGTLGYCSSDEDSNFTVEFYGHGNSISSNEKKLAHSAVHEFCHAMQYVASSIFRDKNLDYIYDNVRYSVHGGTILECKLSNHTDKKYSSYGIAFCETVTDLLTYIEFLYFDPNFNDSILTADDVLNKSHKIVLPNSQLTKDGYTIYLSIARLGIAAFSNTANLSYDNLIKSGNSIILTKVLDRNNNKKNCNDLLYGIMCDARFVEEEYDKYMGNNSYYDLCLKFDDMLKNNSLSSTTVKEIMTNLAIFHNKKIQSQIGDGSISNEDAIKMTNQFNMVFNEMQNEYNSKFTSGDVSNIIDSMKIKQKKFQNK